MATIHYQFADGHYEDIEVTEEFAKQYEELIHEQKLIDRKETRRHQSLDKSMEHGFDIADPSEDIFMKITQKEDRLQIQLALKQLTDKQLKVFILHIQDELSFREIGELLGLGKYTVRDYYYNAIKKLQKFLQ